MSSATSSIDYLEQVQAQSTKETWADQVENGETQNFSLSYVSLEPAPIESIDKHFQIPHSNNINYMISPQVWNPQLFLTKLINQLTPNSGMVTLYLFSINEYLTGDTKNIMCLLYSIVTFIKQHSLGNNLALQHGNS